jgi:glycosyltransferase involved in cell wall biosynthesis
MYYRGTSVQDRAKRRALHLNLLEMKVSRDMPRVCILASTLVTGGAERVAQALALGLGQFGLDPITLCLHDPGTIGDELIEQGVPLISNISSSSRDPLSVPRLARSLRGKEIDLLFSLDHHNALFMGAAASKLAGVPSRVLGIHSTGLWGKKSSFTLSDKLIMPLYSKVIALSEPHAEYIERMGLVDRSKIEIIHNGVDISRFAPPTTATERSRLRSVLGLPDGSFIIVIVAALRPEKNHEMLIRSIRALPEGLRPHLLIAGTGEEEGNLKSLVKEWGLSENVEFMGNREDVHRVLAASDLFVLCSHPVVETMPLSILEAMSTGLPVIATRVGSVEEILTDGIHGLVIDPGDEGELTKSIARMIEDALRREEMGRRGRERVVELFSQERMVASYAGLFRDLIGADTGDSG